MTDLKRCVQFKKEMIEKKLVGSAECASPVTNNKAS